MVKNYDTTIPEDDLDELDLDDLLAELDNYIGCVGPFQVSAEFQEEINIDISWEVAKALETWLGIENRIDSFAQWDRPYLYSEITQNIEKTKDIKELVEIMEYILWAFDLPYSIRNKYFKWKWSYYRLYGNKKTMYNQWKENLPKIRISWESYYLDAKVDIEKMRESVQQLWSYFNQGREETKKVA
jgi:hypothetical protein